MSVRAFAAIVAAAFLLAGLIGLVIQVHASYDQPNPFNAVYGVNLHEVRQSDCGTGFSANSNLGDIDRQQACDDAVSSRRTWAIPLAALGLIGLAGAAFVRTAPRRETEAA